MIDQIHHDIIILGGNFAGIGSAHYLLRHVLPKLSANGNYTYKITLISPSSHVFWKVGAPRCLSDPLVESFYSVPEAFKKYSPRVFKFIQAHANSIDISSRKISFSNTEGTLNGQLAYNSLVIATGTTSTSPLWTLHGDYTQTKSAIEDLRICLGTAETIFIAGGGPVSIETAGEIASSYFGKSITLLSGNSQLLPRLRHARISSAAEGHLIALGVKVTKNVRVLDSTLQADGTTVLALSNGSTEMVDVYIDATGGKPNTAFVPVKWLDVDGRVDTDPQTLRATKAAAGVYSIGDVASYSKQSVLDVYHAVAPLGYSIWSDLLSLQTRHNEADSIPILKEHFYKQIQSVVMFVPVGPNGGVGAVFSWAVPSWLVWLIKSRTFLFNKAPGLATGADYLKA